ncbi:MAG: hypothetical protein H8E55_25515 [Pelagibacterales bacterium]|nr:hypothetical protein [Pelagibacterales bacterium]
MFISDVYGYLDPATLGAAGAIIWRAIGGFGVYLRLYWQKFKEKFKRKA